MERMREQYERSLGDVKDLMRDLRDSNKDTEREKIRDRETSYYLEEEGFYLMGAQ